MPALPEAGARCVAAILIGDCCPAPLEIPGALPDDRLVLTRYDPDLDVTRVLLAGPGRAPLAPRQRPPLIFDERLLL